MSTGHSPEATVLTVGIFEREPEADDRARLGLEERRVLVATDFAADERLLEDVHRLHEPRIDDAEIRDEPGHAGRPREAIELTIEIVHPVADLLMARSFGTRSAPVASTASSSKKNRMSSAESRK